VTIVIAALATWLLGPWLGGAATAGALAGFFRYEYIHWRIHFRLPRNAAERLRREHHLAHHYVDARNYHGVTTRFWDHALGTLPEDCERAYARATHYPPLEGKSNLGQVRPTRV
jgi:sterol desaturase/sphingolipid hydroxylase (fatty acid hydroxylase superfamily)